MVFITCPPDVDELAEDYCLHKLDAETAEAFENHYLACSRCAWVTSETLNFIESFRESEGRRKIRSDP